MVGSVAGTTKIPSILKSCNHSGPQATWDPSPYLGKNLKKIWCRGQIIVGQLFQWYLIVGIFHGQCCGMFPFGYFFLGNIFSNHDKPFQAHITMRYIWLSCRLAMMGNIGLGNPTEGTCFKWSNVWGLLGKCCPGCCNCFRFGALAINQWLKDHLIGLEWDWFGRHTITGTMK